MLRGSILLSVEFLTSEVVFITGSEHSLDLDFKFKKRQFVKLYKYVAHVNRCSRIKVQRKLSLISSICHRSINAGIQGTADPGCIMHYHQYQSKLILRSPQ